MKARELLISALMILAARSAHAESLLQFAVGEFGGAFGTSALTNPDGSTANYNSVALEGVTRLPLYGNFKEFGEIGVIATMHYYTLTNTANVSGETDTCYLLGPGAGLYFRMGKVVVGAEEDYLFARHYATGRSSLVANYSMLDTKIFAGIEFGLFDRFGMRILASTGAATVSKDQTGLSADSNYTDQMVFVTVTYTPGRGL